MSRLQTSVVPVYVTYQNAEHFYVRTGPSTSELPPSEMHAYIQHRFHGGIQQPGASPLRN